MDNINLIVNVLLVIVLIAVILGNLTAYQNGVCDGYSFARRPFDPQFQRAGRLLKNAYPDVFQPTGDASSCLTCSFAPQCGSPKHTTIYMVNPGHENVIADSLAKAALNKGCIQCGSRDAAYIGSDGLCSQCTSHFAYSEAVRKDN